MTSNGFTVADGNLSASAVEGAWTGWIVMGTWTSDGRVKGDWPRVVWPREKTYGNM